MRTKVTLVLLFLNVALFFFIFKFERIWIVDQQSREARRRVFGAETADIRALELAGPNNNTLFSLVRRRDQWMLTKPLDWPAKENAVSSMINELRLLEHETSFSVDDVKKIKYSLAEYGLQDPKLVLTFASGSPDGPRTRVEIGDTTKDGNRLYIRGPDERIHVVNRTLIDALSLPVDQLRADTLLTIPVYEAHSLTLRTTSAPVHVHNDGKRWMFDTPMIAPASKTQIEVTIQELNALHPRTFNPPAPPTLPSAAPTLRIALEGRERSETLLLGEPVTGPGAVKNEVYAQIMNGSTLRNALFTVVVPPALVDKLRNAQVQLRDRRILDFDPRAVTTITLSAPVLPNVPAITLQRLVENNATPDNATWQIVRRSDGAQAPQATPADAVSVQRLLARLTLLSAKDQAGTKEQGFVSDAPTTAELETWGFNRPEREVTLTFSSNTPPLVLRLGTGPAPAPGAEREVYARVGNDPGASVYAVDREIINDLRIEPLAWRDRLVYELPAAARITALKLIDRAQNQPLVDVIIDANGQLSGTPANTDAVKKLLEQLRRVRASAFFRDGFTDRLAVGGDERAWRYELDFTASLPGGGGSDQAKTYTLFFSERVGGAQQVAGSRELNTMFEIELPLVDALFPLTEGRNDPGPPSEPKRPAP